MDPVFIPGSAGTIALPGPGQRDRPARVDAVLDWSASRRGRQRAGGFSSGWAAPGLASALLGDPAILILDEPINGLDPEGILWIRTLLRSLAAEGRTVLVSSHLMSEMALTAEHLVVIGQGRLLADDSVEAVVAASGHNTARVRSPQAGHLAALLAARGAVPTVTAAGELTVTGVSTDSIGDLAAANAITIHELSLQRASLEDAFMDLTHDSVQYRTGTHATATALKKAQPDHDRHRRRPRPTAGLTAPTRQPPVLPTCCARSGPRSAASARPTGVWPPPLPP